MYPGTTSTAAVVLLYDNTEFRIIDLTADNCCCVSAVLLLSAVNSTTGGWSYLPGNYCTPETAAANRVEYVLIIHLMCMSTTTLLQ